MSSVFSLKNNHKNDETERINETMIPSIVSINTYSMNGRSVSMP